MGVVHLLAVVNNDVTNICYTSYSVNLWFSLLLENSTLSNCWVVPPLSVSHVKETYIFKNLASNDAFYLFESHSQSD